MEPFGPATQSLAAPMGRIPAPCSSESTRACLLTGSGSGAAGTIARRWGSRMCRSRDRGLRHVDDSGLLSDLALHTLARADEHDVSAAVCLRFVTTVAHLPRSLWQILPTPGFRPAEWPGQPGRSHVEGAPSPPGRRPDHWPRTRHTMLVAVQCRDGLRIDPLSPDSQSLYAGVAT
jgi:hypothetical protein